VCVCVSLCVHKHGEVEMVMLFPSLMRKALFMGAALISRGGAGGGGGGGAAASRWSSGSSSAGSRSPGSPNNSRRAFTIGSMLRRTQPMAAPDSPLLLIYKHLLSVPDIGTDQADLSMESPYLQTCLGLMNQLRLEHLGLSENGVNSVKRSCCMNIVSTGQFDLTVFILPSGSVIPLHDHPNMAVLSKVLCGELHVNSYSVDPQYRYDNNIEMNSQITNGAEFPVSPSVSRHMQRADDAWMLSPRGMYFA
jgi:hypothetical protein